MGSLCSKDGTATVERQAEPVCFFRSILSRPGHADIVSSSNTMSLSSQYKSGEPRRPVQAEGSDSGKSFSDLYRLGKQVREE